MDPIFIPFFTILGACLVGFLFALWSRYNVHKIKFKSSGDEFGLLDIENNHEIQHYENIKRISNIIANGAQSFLFSEYSRMFIFISIAAGVIFGMVCFTNHESDRYLLASFYALAFTVGAFTSMISGYNGMMIAVLTNGKVCVKAIKSLSGAFRTAFTGGIVMGFGQTAIGLLNLALLIVGYHIFGNHFDSHFSLAKLSLSLACYGLGGSCVGLFGRVCGGIFTKAADVGSDIAGKVVENLPEDDPRNPGVIADCVGDNVGDIAGMGSDMFGSYGESTCASLVLLGISSNIADDWWAFFYPVLISAVGMVTCILVSLIVTYCVRVTKNEYIESTLKYSLLGATILNSAFLFPLTNYCIPDGITFTTQIEDPLHPSTMHVTKWHAYYCLLIGLWSGMFIAIVTEYYTSHRYSPVRKLARSCETGASINIIQGLALGDESVILPGLIIAISLLISSWLAGAFGISLVAVSSLAIMSLCLTIDAFGPIVDNAGGIAEMSYLDDYVRDRTDALDAAGNTTAAIGKGYAISSAAYVGVALYSAFLTSIVVLDKERTILDIYDKRIYFGLILGAILPHAFTAMTMRSVGKAADKMVIEIARQFREIPGLLEGTRDPEYEKCISIATTASLQEMILPGALVILSPIVVGILFGPETVAGLLPGSLAIGILKAISASNTGGAWDNCKKYIEAGHLRNTQTGEIYTKGSDVHKAAVIGDTVGDPLKDTSGPALNILVKLMAIISVVFAPLIANSCPISGVVFKYILHIS